MLRVGQVDVCAGLVDYKVHVIIIEPSSDVWGKKIELIMQPLQKTLPLQSFSRKLAQRGAGPAGHHCGEQAWGMAWGWGHCSGAAGGAWQTPKWACKG